MLLVNSIRTLCKLRIAMQQRTYRIQVMQNQLPLRQVLTLMDVTQGLFLPIIYKEAILNLSTSKICTVT